MPYKLFVLGILLCICWSCENAAISEVAPKKEKSLVSPSLINATTSGLDSMAYKIWWASLPKLPKTEHFFLDILTDASWQACQKIRKRLFGTVLAKIPAEKSNRAALKYLDLSYQNIRYLPNDMADLSNLKHLVLKNNSLRDINACLRHCSQLKTLDVSTNNWTEVPSNLIYLTQLRDLKLVDNKLESLPSFLQNLKSLKTLDISNVHPAMAQGNNLFKEVPQVIGQMPWLEKLLMEYLPIRRFPGNMVRMKNLQVLSLKGCRGIDWRQAFEIMARMPNLQVLDISFIGLHSLPYNVSKLKNLKVLVWTAENNRNAYFIDQLKEVLPNTKIYHNPLKEAIPFIRGNSVKTLVGAGK
ncbi:MAG: leucine-rich repeat domain-containing protein [Aureispira sp.]|nr:leucine-rich repeat domain-containing protein [Aureispira sp.]